MDNTAQIFYLKTRIKEMKQGTMSVTPYNKSELQNIWHQLDLSYESNLGCEDCCLKQKRMIEECVFQFLAGLNKELDEVHGWILRKSPFPSIDDAFAEVKREEDRKQVMLGDKNNNQGLVDGPALVSCSVPVNKSNGEQQKHPWCNHCSHTCWKIYGKLANQTPRRQPEGRGFQAQTSTNDPNINFNKSEGFKSATIRLNKEQIEQLYKLLNQSSLTRTNGDPNIGSCSLAQKGNFLTALNAANKKGMVWIVDSGASHHMTGTTKVFSSYILCNNGQKIKIANGSLFFLIGNNKGIY